MVCRFVLIFLLLGFVFAAWVFCCVYGFCFVFRVLLLFGFDLVFCATQATFIKEKKIDGEMGN